MEPLKAFVAHSVEKDDKPIIDQFIVLLKNYGIEPYLAEEDPQPKPITEKIKEKIQECNCMVVILTKRHKIAYEKKWKPPDWIQQEIGIAFAYEKNILAFIEKDIDIEGVLPQITEYIPFDRDNIEDAIEKINVGISNLNIKAGIGISYKRKDEEEDLNIKAGIEVDTKGVNWGVVAVVGVLACLLGICVGILLSKR